MCDKEKRLLKLFLRIDSDNWRQLIDGLNQNTNTYRHIYHTYMNERTTVAHLSVHCTLSPTVTLARSLSLSLSSLSQFVSSVSSRENFDWICDVSVFLSVINVYRTHPVRSSVKSNILPLLLLCFMLLSIRLFAALHVLLSLSFTHAFLPAGD